MGLLSLGSLVRVQPGAPISARALETFRTWDAGRRPAPEAIVGQSRTLKAKRPPHDRVPLQVLADELPVHVRTLRAAAHDGRLAATFGPRPFFGKPEPRYIRQLAR